MSKIVRSLGRAATPDLGGVGIDADVVRVAVADHQVAARPFAAVQEGVPDRLAGRKDDVVAGAHDVARPRRGGGSPRPRGSSACSSSRRCASGAGRGGGRGRATRSARRRRSREPDRGPGQVPRAAAEAACPRPGPPPSHATEPAGTGSFGAGAGAVRHRSRRGIARAKPAVLAVPVAAAGGEIEDAGGAEGADLHLAGVGIDDHVVRILLADHHEADGRVGLVDEAVTRPLPGREDRRSRPGPCGGVVSPRRSVGVPSRT